MKFRSVKLHEFLTTARKKLANDGHVRIPTFSDNRAVLHHLES